MLEGFKKYIDNNKANISSIGVFLAIFLFVNSSFNGIENSKAFLSLIIFLIIGLISLSILTHKEEKRSLGIILFKILFFIITLYLGLFTYDLILADWKNFLELLMSFLGIFLGLWIAYLFFKLLINKMKKTKMVLIPITILLFWWQVAIGHEVINDIAIKISHYSTIYSFQFLFMSLFNSIILAFCFIVLINIKKILH
ncbi:MAG: hypothetical protein Q8L27_03475 [archaeon]|nr:hypothetical protein [archaeon]